MEILNENDKSDKNEQAVDGREVIEVQRKDVAAKH